MPVKIETAPCSVWPQKMTVIWRVCTRHAPWFGKLVIKWTHCLKCLECCSQVSVTCWHPHRSQSWWEPWAPHLCFLLCWHPKVLLGTGGSKEILEYSRGIKPRNRAPLLMEWRHLAGLSQILHLVVPEAMSATALGRCRAGGGGSPVPPQTQNVSGGPQALRRVLDSVHLIQPHSKIPFLF